MRTGFFALSSLCLLGTSAMAQPPAAPAGPDVPLPSITATGDAPLQNAIVEATAETASVGPRAWASIEYLRWWITPGNSLPLIQTVPTELATVGGTLADGAASQFFPPQREIKFGGFNGIRPTIGFTGDRYGFDLSGFWMEGKNLSGSISSNGTPFAVAQQYTADGNSQLTSLYASLAGNYVGGADAATDVRVWGFDANARLPYYRLLADWNHALVGFRYFNLQENLYVNSNSTFSNGTQSIVSDIVHTKNEFYGGQIGLASRYGGMERGLGLDGVLKVALGGVRQQAELIGTNTNIFPDGTRDPVRGGLYVQPTNDGIHERTKLAAMIEYNLNLTYNFNENWQVFVGYSINYISSVIRPGDALDPVVNDFRIRYVAAPSFSTGDRPAFSWNMANDFWVQGVNFGLRVQY